MDSEFITLVSMGYMYELIESFLLVVILYIRVGIRIIFRRR
jgi:hypothetical protein